MIGGKKVYGIFARNRSGIYTSGAQGHVATFCYRQMAQAKADGMNVAKGVMWPERARFALSGSGRTILITRD